MERKDNYIIRVLYRLITQRVKHFKHLFVIILLNGNINKNNNNQCHRKLEYYLRPIKGYFKQECQVSEKYNYFMRSILGWGMFSLNCCVSAAWHESDQPLVLLRCNGS